MGAGLEPPRRILVHGHWLLNGQKMSKSVGNVIKPLDVLKAYHTDIIRFYMIKEGGQRRDGNWSNDAIRDRATYLANSWGNLIHRMNSRVMHLRRAVVNVFEPGSEGIYRGVSSSSPEEDAKLRESIETAIVTYRFHMRHLDFQAALLAIEDIWRAVLHGMLRLLIIGKPICHRC
jgi:methionyl-tRNA synthetase